MTGVRRAAAINKEDKGKQREIKVGRGERETVRDDSVRQG
jgi:hypothetical protein